MKSASISTTLMGLLQPCQSTLETNSSLMYFSTSTTCLGRSCCNGKTPTVGSIAPTGDRIVLMPAQMEAAAAATCGRCRKPAHGCGSKCQRVLCDWTEAIPKE